MHGSPSRWGRALVAAAWLVTAASGCATVKQSDTPRTGVEQLLISSAVDRALDQVDLSPLNGSKVFVDPQFLDCTDKNYVFISLNHRLLAAGATLAAKADDADAVLEVGSGGVGTDRQDVLIGISEIPLPPPSPIAIPPVSLFDRSKGNGTAKLIVLAFDAKTRAPILNSGILLARSDYKTWKVLGGGSYETGSVHRELAAAESKYEEPLLTTATKMLSPDSPSPPTPPPPGVVAQVPAYSRQ